MQILLSLMSGVALLIWGTHVTRRGMLELLGPRLRLVLAAGTASPARGFVAGLGVTALIQSSSATALMTSAFVAEGLVSLSAALPIVLGADVGTSMMARLLSVDISWLSPLLLVTGIAMRLSGQGSLRGRAGEVVVGLGLITLALQLIRLYAAPLLHADLVRAIFASLGQDALLAVVIGAMLALLAYSSLAAVLLTATLAMGGVIAPQTALPLVLGANLGSGLIACLANSTSAPAARRVSLANLLFRITGVLVFLPLRRALPGTRRTLYRPPPGPRVAAAHGQRGNQRAAPRYAARAVADECAAVRRAGGHAGPAARRDARSSPGAGRRQSRRGVNPQRQQDERLHRRQTCKPPSASRNRPGASAQPWPSSAWPRRRAAPGSPASRKSAECSAALR
ncbi:Na/Pi cotransporter family protein [Cupriavidus oxalaticus]|uniref:Na/Pi cotransporter family protein n=1 Tax=Cupriavidus oxalaticus TaxID=96344 RepID=UPI001F10C17B|nr:Na/Pi symporter [Cupriavidus oxalaticus]